MKNILKIWILAISFFLVSPASALLELEITGGMDSGYPIAVFSFVDETGKSLGPDMAKIVRNDLQFSGKFSPLQASATPDNVGSTKNIVPADWNNQVNAVVAGTVTLSGDKIVLTYQLKDLAGNTDLLNKSITFSQTQLRQASHLVSNQIYEAILNEKGAFLTKIAYVSVNPGINFPYRLVVADYDGHNERVILRSKEPVMSPSWDPTGTKLAYVSFETKHAAIFQQNVTSNQRIKLAQFKGINGNPVYSPQGDRLAMVLSKDGNPEIYVYNLNTKALIRMTNNRVIDTEPAWSADGNYLYFSSERAGRPQIYRMEANNPSAVERVTWENVSNLNPAVSPDGKLLAMVTREGNSYRIAKQELGTKFLTVLTRNHFDESPSFAPNGSMIIYSTMVRGKKGLALVSSDGRFHANLPSTTGTVSAPAWSPFLK